MIMHIYKSCQLLFLKYFIHLMIITAKKQLIFIAYLQHYYYLYPHEKTYRKSKKHTHSL